ncbi:hypothetical protein [Methanospirillum sp.]
MPKYSISMTEELAREISDRYPDSPFSTAIAKLVRKGLDVDATIVTDTTNLTDATCITNPINPTIPTVQPVTPGLADIADMIRSIVQEEMRKFQPGPVIVEPTIVTEPVVVPAPESPEWLTNAEVVAMLPESLPRGTRSSRVSRAIASGKLPSNGLSGKECRIQRADAIAWIQA